MEIYGKMSTVYRATCFIKNKHEEQTQGTNKKNKRRGHKLKGVILHRDNARPHPTVQTVQTINNLGWKLLPHPPWSPDLAPSDFHLFGALKEFMRGTKFESDNEVKSVVSDWLRYRPKDFYAEGIRELRNVNFRIFAYSRIILDLQTVYRVLHAQSNL